ncbi:MAG TPA: baseplate J/gp47 family protein, partial [Iamia sp.]|nr:baseplate J/gp47 family protein [Iamia sp.]
PTHRHGLAPGATSATVEGHHRLEPDELILVRSADGRADAVVRVRHGEQLDDQDATRLIWDPQDALRTDVEPWPTDFEILRHNLVLADEGGTVDATGSPWLPLPPPGSRRYRPALPGTGLVFAGPRPRLRGAPASAALEPCVLGSSLPAISVEEHIGGDVVGWTPARSLLAAGPFDRELVVELDNADVAHLRFGDDLSGARPAPGADLRARFRTGVGERGNVRPRTLTAYAGDDPRVVGVSNPVAAIGGRGREPLGSVRLLAPEAPRINDRAVVEADQVALARQEPGVVDVAVRTRWSGSWPLVEVAVRTQPNGADEVVERVRRRLSARQLVGVEVSVGAATAEPIELEVQIVAERGADEWRVTSAVESTLARWLGAPGALGLGVGLAQSAVVARVTPVDGVAEVTLTRFRSVLDTGSEVRTRIEPAFGRFLVVASGSMAFGRSSFVHPAGSRR